MNGAPRVVFDTNILFSAVGWLGNPHWCVQAAPLKTINEIVAGKAAITSDTALQLEKVLGVPASFWTNHERIYRDTLARHRETDELG